MYIKRLLSVIGSVIRINPYEVHINDPDFYDEVYIGSSRGKTDKWFWSVSCIATGCLKQIAYIYST